MSKCITFGNLYYLHHKQTLLLGKKNSLCNQKSDSGSEIRIADPDLILQIIPDPFGSGSGSNTLPKATFSLCVDSSVIVLGKPIKFASANSLHSVARRHCRRCFVPLSFVNSVVDPNRLCSEPDPVSHVHSDPDHAPDPYIFGSGSYLNFSNFLEIKV